jgi:hypothetical protein
MPLAAVSGKGRVLSALVFLGKLYKTVDVPKRRIQLMANISDPTFAPMLSRMVQKGLIEYGFERGTIKITNLGKQQAPTVQGKDLVTSNQEHHETIKKKLKGKALLIFNFLADGKVHDRLDVMAAVDCINPKTFAPLISRELKKHGYIVYIGKRGLQLNKEMCFPFVE